MKGHCSVSFVAKFPQSATCVTIALKPHPIYSSLVLLLLSFGLGLLPP